jgi:hypothetical protein
MAGRDLRAVTRVFIVNDDHLGGPSVGHGVEQIRSYGEQFNQVMTINGYSETCVVGQFDKFARERTSRHGSCVTTTSRELMLKYFRQTSSNGSTPTTIDPWVPSGDFLLGVTDYPLGSSVERIATAPAAPKAASPAESSAEARKQDHGEVAVDKSADSGRTEELNRAVYSRDTASLAEVVAKKQQYADALAAHQRTLDGAEQAKREHAAAVERSRQQAADYQRQLQAYNQGIAAGKYEAEQAKANQAEADERLRRARAEEQRLAEIKRKEEERNRPVEFKEGVVLCDRPNPRSKEWRCRGPLQLTYGEIDRPSGNVALDQACGSGKSIRDLGMTGGFRAFGCGFGIHPTARDYPGNLDIPAMLGVYVSSRATFRCPRSRLAYCRGN